MSESVVQRLRRADPTIFSGSSAVERLGWTSHLGALGERATEIERRWHDRPPRHERTLLIGMGGSAATAGMFAGVHPGTLSVCDTSNPDTIAGLDFANVNVIASSKSGGTIETIALLAWALSHGLDPRDLTVITDEGTPLAELGRSLEAAVFTGDPDCGGRFSALSAFGLVGAIAAGWTAEELVESGRADTSSLWDEPFALGVELARERFCPLAGVSRGLSSTLWLEQLLAESTGKDGRGLVPVTDPAGHEPPSSASLVADIHRWHVTAAAAARAIGVDPFNQPDVERTKDAVFTELRQPVPWHYRKEASVPERVQLDRAGYVALQVFGSLDLEDKVEQLRERLGQHFGMVTAGLGPRYLHSTGQLHKGGWSDVAALQVVIRPRSEPERISGRHYSFHDLHRAQSRADAVAMLASGRAVVRLLVESLDDVAPAIGL